MCGNKIFVQKILVKIAKIRLRSQKCDYVFHTLSLALYLSDRPVLDARDFVLMDVVSHAVDAHNAEQEGEDGEGGSCWEGQAAVSLLLFAATSNENSCQLDCNLCCSQGLLREEGCDGPLAGH